MSKRHPSGRRRIRSRRAVIARIALLVKILGLFCLAIALGLAVASFSATGISREKQRSLASIYLAVAVGFLLVRWFLFRIQKYISSGGSHGENAAPRREGAVLILVLVVVALVAAMLLNVQLSALAARRQAEAALTRAQLRIAATDAVRESLPLLAQPPAGGYEGTNAPWATPLDFSDPTGIQTRVYIEDENRRFDVNNVLAGDTNTTAATRKGADILMDIMTLCGDFTPVQRVAALQDWIDEDDAGIREGRFYAQKDPPYHPPNRILYSLDELLHVEGFTPELFARHPYAGPREPFKAHLDEMLTALPVRRSSPLPVNVNTASRTVLQGVFGIEQDEAVDRLLIARQTGTPLTMDIVSAMLDRELFEQVRPYLALQSEFFRVRAHAERDGKWVTLRALVRRSDEGEVNILQWLL